MSTRSFFIFNVSLVLCWLTFTFVMIREHRKAVLATDPV